MQKRTLEFTSKLTRAERVLGWCYLPVHTVVLPVLLGMYPEVSGSEMSLMTMNVIYYAIGVAYVLAMMRRGLRREFDRLVDFRLRGLLSIMPAYLMDTVLSYLALAVLMLFETELANPNSEQVYDLAVRNRSALFCMAVVMAPVVEETLFRGVVFAGIRGKSRTAAYAVSAVLFGVYHVWQHALAYGDVRLLIYALQYVPKALALAWCYERTDSLWVPIFYHGMINALNVMYMQML